MRLPRLTETKNTIGIEEMIIFTSIEQNLMDAGCDKEFRERFMNLTETQRTAEMLNMLDIHRKTLLDGIHADERKIYCLDYLVTKLQNN